MTTGWSDDEFGETWAPVYDEAFAHLDQDAQDAAAFLIERLGDAARVLELGVGTGRLAIPLATAGISVVGVDSSTRMLQALAAKSSGLPIEGVRGDMTAPPVDGPFDLVLIGFNTLFSLPDQDRQARCLQSAAALLTPGGELVIEAAVPQPWRFSNQAYAGDAREDQISLEMADHDPVTQTVRSARVLVSDTLGVRNLPLKMRYAWPSEIDLMARLAGLARTGRWAGWQDEPFDADATRHVSVYTHRDPQQQEHPHEA